MGDLIKIILAVIGTIILFGVAVWGIDYLAFSYSKATGEHNVVITAVEKTPFNTNVYAKTEGESSQEDVYCIQNNKISAELYKKLQTHVRSKKNLLLTFSQEYELLPWLCRDAINVSEL